MDLIEEVTTFEREWNFQLPEDFKNHISKYGLDPNLLPIRWWFDGFPYDAPWNKVPGWRQEEPISKDFLSEPCPITPEADLTQPKHEDYAHIDRAPRPGENPSQTDIRVLQEADPISRGWIHKLPPHKIDPYQGTICIAYHGCTYYDLLIVTGPARGRILNMDADYGPPFWDKSASFEAYLESLRNMRKPVLPYAARK